MKKTATIFALLLTVGAANAITNSQVTPKVGTISTGEKVLFYAAPGSTATAATKHVGLAKWPSTKVLQLAPLTHDSKWELATSPEVLASNRLKLTANYTAAFSCSINGSGQATLTWGLPTSPELGDTSDTREVLADICSSCTPTTSRGSSYSITYTPAKPGLITTWSWRARQYRSSTSRENITFAVSSVVVTCGPSWTPCTCTRQPDQFDTEESLAQLD